MKFYTKKLYLASNNVYVLLFYVNIYVYTTLIVYYDHKHNENFVNKF